MQREAECAASFDHVQQINDHPLTQRLATPRPATRHHTPEHTSARAPSDATNPGAPRRGP